MDMTCTKDYMTKATIMSHNNRSLRRYSGIYSQSKCLQCWQSSVLAENLQERLLQDNLISCLQAAELRTWGLARHYLEQGLIKSPKSVLMAEKLLEILLNINDYGSAANVAHHLLKIHPFHPRASQLSILFRGSGITTKKLDRLCAFA